MIDHIKNIDELEELIRRYHESKGTYNRHYSHFDLYSWRPWMKELGLSKEEALKMQVEDYAVRISYADNSHSYDCYTVLLKDILAWGEQNANK